MKLIKIAFKSALNRKVSLSLAIFSIAISILLLLGVDTLRKQAKNNFLNTISQTDLIVGARSSPTNLLLYSAFTNGIIAIRYFV
jgi:putative ABC transport system permease protein